MLRALKQQNRIIAGVSQKLVEDVKNALKKAKHIKGLEIEVHDDIYAIYVTCEYNDQLETIYNILSRVLYKRKGVRVFEERGHITVHEMK